jgi:hypothetical protein
MYLQAHNKHKQNDKHYHDGRYWTYTSHKAFCAIFPEFTERQIRHNLQILEKEGFLIKGNYNKSSYDRTAWYALTDKAFEHFPEAKPCDKTDTIDETNLSNRLDEFVSPIPDINSDILNNHSNDYLSATTVALKNPEKIKSKSLSFLDLSSNNAYNVPESLLSDFIVNRKAKRAPITKNAWERIQKVMGQCKEHGLDPIDCFSRMVASSWRSMELEYFLKDGAVKPSANQLDHKSTAWEDDMEYDKNGIPYDKTQPF